MTKINREWIKINYITLNQREHGFNISFYRCLEIENETGFKRIIEEADNKFISYDVTKIMETINEKIKWVVF